jgi:hypothetical protein
VGSGFSGHSTPAGAFPSFGSFQYTIVCNVCGNGTSAPQRSSVTFSVFNASGLTPADFIQNSGGYYWGVDVGVPTGNGRFETFNVASDTVNSNTTSSSPVPEPTSIYLLTTAVIGSVWGIRRKRKA